MKVFIALVTAGLLGLGAGGRADEKKSEAKGTLTLGEKKYAMAHAIAYENMGPFKMKETVVILTEKPLDTAKLKASFKKNGNDEDFFPNADHIKLVFAESDKGKLTQLAIQSGGGTIIRQDDQRGRPLTRHFESAPALFRGRLSSRPPAARWRHPRPSSRAY